MVAKGGLPSHVYQPTGEDCFCGSLPQLDTVPIWEDEKVSIILV